MNEQLLKLVIESPNGVEVVSKYIDYLYWKLGLGSVVIVCTVGILCYFAYRLHKGD